MEETPETMRAFDAALAKVKIAIPDFEHTRATARVFFDALKDDFTEEQVLWGISHHIKVSQWSPRPADIRKHILERRKHLPTAPVERQLAAPKYERDDKFRARQTAHIRLHKAITQGGASPAESYEGPFPVDLVVSAAMSGFDRAGFESERVNPMKYIDPVYKEMRRLFDEEWEKHLCEVRDEKGGHPDD